ncbi:hypothetical protein D5S18_17725 [Nocardia panacis]|uniref:Uncharacterized protein n=1 Tax=Nocardia panacis TaxID=2340916 RepID=A0A3A4KGS3_9NOCA|nr:hypothetical protein [Nocardia panacis]RJO75198.1 hypothetical protein D5S18_17725 [Nocardia panacis]
MLAPENRTALRCERLQQSAGEFRIPCPAVVLVANIEHLRMAMPEDPTQVRARKPRTGRARRPGSEIASRTEQPVDNGAKLHSAAHYSAQRVTGGIVAAALA